MKLSQLFFFIFLILAACSPSQEKYSIANPEFISYKVDRTMPHDSSAYTQGLLVHEGKIYESTGREGLGLEL